jgi:hypothetical protein
VVTVRVGDHYHVEVRQIDVHLFNILLENGGVVAGIEKNALSFKLDERGESPIRVEGRFFPKCIVQNRNTVLGGAGCCACECDDGCQEQPDKTTRAECHLRPAFWVGYMRGVGRWQR